jgi:CubicO group peptidase (beta-lactamase class C family)
MMFWPSVPPSSLPASGGFSRPDHGFRFLVVATGVVVLVGAFAAPGASAAPPAAELDSFVGQLDREHRGWLSAGRVPGAAIAVVRDGGTAWAGGYGQADPARGTPVGPDTVFQVGSISKPVTAWGVLRLVDKGLLDLDAPVESYLTRWHLPASPYDTDGITIRRLLTHSAGLTVHGYDGTLSTDPLPSLEESLNGNKGKTEAVTIATKPGSRYRYSGGGYTIIQLVIEEVTGEPFATYMRREVLDPLGMTSSNFGPRADLRPATAVGHDADGHPHPHYLFTELAAAGLYTTAPDLARFAAAAMTGPQGQAPGRGVLSADTVAEMLTPVSLPIESVAADVTRAPRQVTVGLGYAIENEAFTTTMVWHNGDNTGWGAVFATLPERGEGIVILANASPASTFRDLVLDAWTNWLGIRPANTSAAPQPNQSTTNKTVLALAGLLAVAVIVCAGYLLHAHRTRRRS